MPVDPTIEKILDQAIAKTHEVWLSQIQREDQGMGAFAELMRQSFGAAGVGQTHLAAGILSQRSVQAQPQQQPGPGGTGVPAGMKLVPL